LAPHSPSQSNPAPQQLDSPALEEAVLDLLVGSDSHRPWSEHELALEAGDATATADAIAGLRATGLIHTTSDGFILATRPAIRYSQLIR